MKNILVAFLLGLVSLSIANGAEYKGKNIDGIEFQCTVYSFETGTYYYFVTVIFYDNQATVTFSDGGYITMTLDDEVIQDPESIQAYNYDSGYYWSLSLEGLD